MIMWAMSDRAVPRSLRMMEGFGIHTFRLVNEAGDTKFVKFHWRPKLGNSSVLWDEASRSVAPIRIFTAGICGRRLHRAIFRNMN